MREDTVGYVARWDDPDGGGVTTQGDAFAELDAWKVILPAAKRPRGLRL